MADISIKGSCVTREAFNYQENVFGQNIFHVSNYIFRKPIAVISSSEINGISKSIIDNTKLELYNRESVRDFVIRQVDGSFTKNFYNTTPVDDSYFIIDFIDERIDLIQIDNSYIEYRKEFIDVLKKNGVNYKFVKNNKNIIFKYIDRFIDGIRKNYPDNRIILHKAFAVHTTKINDITYPLTSIFRNPFGNKSLKVYSLKKVNDLNLMYSEIYDYIENKYPNIKIIELPINNYYSPVDHVFGKGIFHYNNEFYYDFLANLRQLIIDGKQSNQHHISIENKKHINQLVQKQDVISNIYETNNLTKVLKRNPEELLYNPLNYILDYYISSEGKPVIKSYTLSNSLPGILIYGNNRRIKGKLIFSKDNRLKSIYSLYNNGNTQSIHFLNHYSIDKVLLKDESGNDILNQLKVHEEINKTEKVCSYFNQNEIIVKVIFNELERITRVIFYENEKLDRVIEFKDDKLNRVMIYNNSGKLSEDLKTGDFINIGKIQFKTSYLINGKKIMYKYHASGDLQSKTFLTEGNHYEKREIYKKMRLTKVISYHPKYNKKLNVVEYRPDGRRKEIEYFESGTRKTISYFDEDGQLIDRKYRDNENEFMRSEEIFVTV